MQCCITASHNYRIPRNIGGFGGLKKTPKFISPNFSLTYQARACFVDYHVKMSLLRYFKKVDRFPTFENKLRHVRFLFHPYTCE